MAVVGILAVYGLNILALKNSGLCTNLFTNRVFANQRIGSWRGGG